KVHHQAERAPAPVDRYAYGPGPWFGQLARQGRPYVCRTPSLAVFGRAKPLTQALAPILERVGGDRRRELRPASLPTPADCERRRPEQHRLDSSDGPFIRRPVTIIALEPTRAPIRFRCDVDRPPARRHIVSSR